MAVFDVIAAMRPSHARLALIVPDAAVPPGLERALGVVTQSHVLEKLTEGKEIFSD
jgi:hypothetical protein